MIEKPDLFFTGPYFEKCLEQIKHTIKSEYENLIDLLKGHGLDVVYWNVDDNKENSQFYTRTRLFCLNDDIPISRSIFEQLIEDHPSLSRGKKIALSDCGPSIVRDGRIVLKLMYDVER